MQVTEEGEPFEDSSDEFPLPEDAVHPSEYDDWMPEPQEWFSATVIKAATYLLATLTNGELVFVSQNVMPYNQQPSCKVGDFLRVRMILSRQEGGRARWQATEAWLEETVPENEVNRF
jgi:hypothetical protein